MLLALLDADHADHLSARTWLEAEIEAGWASCALTENGFVRIISQPRYPGAISPSRAIDLLRRATSTPHHEHWPRERSLLDASLSDPSRIHGPRQVTDAYLLALAVARDGRLATFDRGVPVEAVRGATAHHLVVL